MKPDRSGLVHAIAHCDDCDFEVGKKNAVGLAAQHAAANPDHTVHAETGSSMTWNPRDDDD